MPWIKLDDSFLTNPKVMQAGLEARALYIAGLCHCGKTLSDGAIPRAMVPKLAALADVGDAAGAAATLVALELWHETAEGYEVHDYLDYNPTRQQAESNAAQRSISGSIGGRRSGQVRAARAKQNRSNLLHDGDEEAATKQMRSNSLSKSSSKSSSKIEANREANREPVSRIPYPVDPSPETPTTPPLPPLARGGAPPPATATVPPVGKVQSRRAQPLPDDFALTDELRDWATARRLGLDLEREHEKFCTYWRGEGKLKKDWSQTWQHWMLREAERPRRAPPPAPVDPDIAKYHPKIQEGIATLRAWKPPEVREREARERREREADGVRRLSSRDGPTGNQLPRTAD